MIEVRNELNTCDFHDSDICHASVKNGDMILELSHMNVLKDNSGNPHGVAMMTSEVRVVVKEFDILEARKDFFVKAGEPRRNERISTQDVQAIMDMIEGEIVYGFGLKNGMIELEITTYGNYDIMLHVAYDGVLVQWEKFVDKAWFEKWKEKGINGTGHDEA